MWWFTDLDILCSSFKTTCRAADTSCRHPLKWPKYLLFESFHYNWFASTYLLTNQVYAVSFSYQRLAYAAWIVYISCVISYDTTTILKWIRLEKDPLNLLCVYPESISIFAFFTAFKYLIKQKLLLSDYFIEKLKLYLIAFSF